jgi:hypothetical protein
MSSRVLSTLATIYAQEVSPGIHAFCCIWKVNGRTCQFFSSFTPTSGLCCMVLNNWLSWICCSFSYIQRLWGQLVLGLQVL